MKLVRSLLSALVVAAVAATVASASPGGRQLEPTPTPEVTVPPEASPSPPPEASPSPSPSQAPGPTVVEEGTERTSGSERFAACEGKTGLENAACRVGANLEDHPNAGLAHASPLLASKAEAAGPAGLAGKDRGPKGEHPGNGHAGGH
jgi:hypothetical protein